MVPLPDTDVFWEEQTWAFPVPNEINKARSILCKILSKPVVLPEVGHTVGPLA